MGIISKVNNWLAITFGQGVHIFAINDNDRGREGPILKHGRLCLHTPGRNGGTIGWSFGKGHCGASVTLHHPGDDDSISGHVAVPGIYLYFGLERLLSERLQRFLGLYNPDANVGGKYISRRIGWSIHDWTFWARLWDNDNRWSCDDPWWWSFTFSLNPLDIFGRRRYSSEVIQEQEVEVPMPEGSYMATVKICADSWTRPGFPWWPLTKMILRAHVDDMEPIPHPGKGTMSYNCGPDALHGICCPARNPEEAIGKIVSSVLRDRMRYGGSHRYELPSRHDTAGEVGGVSHRGGGPCAVPSL